jgi:NADPH:quinone reductase-like Zn-dependent oxidoreductase
MKHNMQRKEGGKMEAVVITGNGIPDGLAVVQTKKPATGKDGVLVRVCAATVTASDVGGMGLVRLSRPLRRFSAQPDLIPGVEFAGVVEAAGDQVRNYKAGDRVFGSAGTKFGTWAEYVRIPESGVLALMPSNVSFDEAGGICDGAMTAFHFLINKANLRKGQSVLIIGASGSVGSSAVQLARHLQCSVTAVCSASHARLVRSLGADMAVDYNKEDFTKNGQAYDVIFDAAARSSFRKCRQSLTPRGVYLTTVPSPAILFSMLKTRLGDGKKALFAASGLAKREVKLQALGKIVELIRAGHLTPVVDRHYALGQISEALQYVGQGHKQGSVLISAD